jgi:hypothetical protein
LRNLFHLCLCIFWFALSEELNLTTQLLLEDLLGVQLEDLDLLLHPVLALLVLLALLFELVYPHL